MSKIILTIGPPASGKTTWAKEFVNKNPKYVRINRDSYRWMLFNKQHGTPDEEFVVTQVVDSAVDVAILNKKNVILDQTNCNIVYLRETIEKYCTLADIEFQIFNVPLTILLSRNESRPKDERVSPGVVERMWKQYMDLFDANFDFSTRKKLHREPSAYKFPSRPGKNPAVIFDLDGTLAHALGKRSYYEEEFCELDEVDDYVRWILQRIKESAHIIIVTGRKDTPDARMATINWLLENNIEYSKLFMRSEIDYRKDYIVKKEIYLNDIEPLYDVLAVFDDRNSVVEMWRSLGLKCYQCEPGNF